MRPVEEIPQGIEVSTRYSKENEYIFVQNFNKNPIKIKLDLEGSEVLLGTYEDEIIEGFDTIILKK